MTRRRLLPSPDKVLWGFALALGTLAVVALALVIWFFGMYKIAPDVTGDSVDEAAQALHDAGIPIDITGADGTVVDQHPSAGERWFRYQNFILTYTDASGTHTVGGPDANKP
ncbi:PASTA domain-containing protein [Demequina sp.]|uniref:PASTA domain-containing protein n=1 Tax=Demequina sp. TaxID=2050685 RepID=UPI0025C272DC|nr:PASTA domain-containing protein [Demequina sp.]